MSLEPLIAAGPAIFIHAIAASLAMVLGAFVLWRRKGTARHRLLGRIWVGLMMVVSLSALFITEIRMVGPFSPLHVFSVVTLVALASAVAAAKAGDIRRHRATMQSVYLLALGLTGAFTLLPGRRMHEVLFGSGAGWTPSIVAMSLVFVLVGLAFWRLLGRRTA